VPPSARAQLMIDNKFEKSLFPFAAVFSLCRAGKIVDREVYILSCFLDGSFSLYIKVQALIARHKSVHVHTNC